MEIKLKVKKSKISGAGKGLFTLTPIKKGTAVVEYLGEKLTWKEALKRYDGGNIPMHYVFCITANNCIDAGPTPKELARYANDANGGVDKKSQKNNSEYEIIKKRAYIVATKNIKAGEEILVDYGDEYWEALEDEKKKKEKKKSKEAAKNKKSNKKTKKSSRKSKK